jgi:hypothetical protein
VPALTNCKSSVSSPSIASTSRCSPRARARGPRSRASSRGGGLGSRRATVLVAHEAPRPAATTSTSVRRPTRVRIPGASGRSSARPARAHAPIILAGLRTGSGDSSGALPTAAAPVPQLPARVGEHRDAHNLPARSPVRGTNAASMIAGRGRMHQTPTELPGTFVRP